MASSIENIEVKDTFKTILDAFMNIKLPKPTMNKDMFYWFPGMDKDSWDERLMYY